ncbi:MAG: hypothetical protein AB8B50_01365 [Pirellulaceae bacterium]
MSTKNRGDKIQLLHKVVTKHFTPVDAPSDRSVLEQMIYACCLEDADYEAAEDAFLRLQESFIDWNEVRVTTITELSESLVSLPDPAAAAVRVKKNLQSLFESRYSFDIDDMIKMNQGKAVQELEKLAGMSKFVLGYVVQNALGGHSIPVSKSILHILLETEIISENEAAKWQVPGLERTVPKTKGQDFGSCLHQFALLVAEAPGGKQAKTLLKEAGAPQKKEAPAKAAKKSAAPKKAASTKKAAPEKKAAAKASPKKAASKPATPKKKSSPAKSTAKKSTTKSKRKPR